MTVPIEVLLDLASYRRSEESPSSIKCVRAFARPYGTMQPGNYPN